MGKCVDMLLECWQYLGEGITVLKNLAFYWLNFVK